MLLQSAGNTKTLCFCPKNFIPSVTMRPLNPSGRSLHWQTAKALVQSPLPFCHFLPHKPEIFATF